MIKKPCRQQQEIGMEKRKVLLIPRSRSRIFFHFPSFERFAFDWQEKSGLDEPDSKAIVNRMIEFFDLVFPPTDEHHSQPSLSHIYRVGDKVIAIVTWKRRLEKTRLKESFDTFEVLEEELPRIIAFWDAAARRLIWEKQRAIAAANDLALTKSLFYGINNRSFYPTIRLIFKPQYW